MDGGQCSDWRSEARRLYVWFFTQTSERIIPAVRTAEKFFCVLFGQKSFNSCCFFYSWQSPETVLVGFVDSVFCGRFWLDVFNALNEEFVIKHSVCIWAYEAFTMWVGHYGEVLEVLEVLPYKSFLVSFYLDKVENNIWVDLWFNPDFQIFVAQASDVKS